MALEFQALIRLPPQSEEQMKKMLIQVLLKLVYGSSHYHYVRGCFLTLPPIPIHFIDPLNVVIVRFTILPLGPIGVWKWIIIVNPVPPPINPINCPIVLVQFIPLPLLPHLIPILLLRLLPIIITLRLHRLLHHHLIIVLHLIMVIMVINFVLTPPLLKNSYCFILSSVEFTNFVAEGVTALRVFSTICLHSTFFYSISISIYIPISISISIYVNDYGCAIVMEMELFSFTQWVHRVIVCFFTILQPP